MWAKANIQTRNFCAFFFFSLCSLIPMWSFCHQVVCAEFGCSYNSLLFFADFVPLSLFAFNERNSNIFLHISFVRSNQNTLWSFVRFTGKWTLKFILGCHLPNGMRKRCCSLLTHAKDKQTHIHTHAKDSKQDSKQYNVTTNPIWIWICFTSDGRSSFGMGNG